MFRRGQCSASPSSALTTPSGSTPTPGQGVGVRGHVCVFEWEQGWVHKGKVKVYVCRLEYTRR